MAKSDKWLPALPEDGRMAGCRVRKREVGDHVEAEVKTIRETTEGVRLQVSFGAEKALVYEWQIIEE